LFLFHFVLFLCFYLFLCVFCICFCLFLFYKMVFLIEGQFIRFLHCQFIFSIYISIDFISVVVFFVLDMTSVLALLYQKLAVSHKHTRINIVVKMTSVLVLLNQKLTVSHTHSCISIVLEMTSICALLNQKLTVSHKHTLVYQYCIGDDKCTGFT
jgi:hypothetical protein